MAVTTISPTFLWQLPTEGGDSGNWDKKLNELIAGTAAGPEPVDGIDTVLAAVKSTADNAINKDGSVSMTGELDILTERYVVVTTGTSGTVTLDLDAANFFVVIPTASFSIAFSNVPASPDAVFIQIYFSNGAGQTLTSWASSVDWPGGTVPTLTAGVDLITGFTIDGGTIWHLSHAVSNSS